MKKIIYPIALTMIVAASGTASAACHNRPAPAAGKVIFFQDGFCNGASKTFDMSKDNGWFAYIGDDWNDKASSIQVGEGVKVTVYDNGNFGGARAPLFPGNYPDLWIYHDKISSFQIEKIPPFGPLVILLDNESGNGDQARHHLGQGKFNFSGNQEELLLRQRASEIWLHRGAKAILWDDYNCTGNPMVLDTQDTAIKLHPRAWGDRVKSIEVTAQTPAELAAGKSKYLKITGRWVPVASCQGTGCGGTSLMVEVGAENDKVVKEETDIGAALSVMVGMESSVSAGAAVSATVTAKMEVTGTVSTNFIKSVSTGFKTSVKRQVTQQCKDNSQLWQWEATMDVLDKANLARLLDYYATKTDRFLCLPTGTEPNPINNPNFGIK